MQQRTRSDSDEGAEPRSASDGQQYRQASGTPLVIVSERGRHSDESRRIVRAQAARASAAQSRVTRARNREERDGTVRESPVSPSAGGPFQFEEPPAPPESVSSGPGPNVIDQPLVVWLAGILNTSPVGLMQDARARATSTLTSGASSAASGARAAASFSPFLSNEQSPTSPRPQLPAIVPKGFISLQQRMQLSEILMELLSRTSCFDFDSPGVEERLHQLLLDLVIGYLGASISSIAFPGHPIQGHFRVACTCLTIFQGQRADGEVFARESKYQRGLDAAWSETIHLDQNALQDPESAAASMWAVFIIQVSTGSTATLFHQLLHSIFGQLRLHSWKDVRNSLLEFIYPVSFLDGPCESFYNRLFSTP